MPSHSLDLEFCQSSIFVQVLTKHGEEGAVTCVICIVGFFIIIDFPAKVKPGKFLSAEEKQFVIDRINNDRGDAIEDEVTAARILYHLKDWRLYFWAINLMASTLPGYAYSYFLPIM